ncbi:MAG: MATE family efflux transporter [Gammaproteobacteria bacterium]
MNPVKVLQELMVRSGRAWAFMRLAVAGGNLDYTTGSIRRAVLLLSIPMVLEMAMESIFAIVDIFFVSYLGAAAVATVGLTEALLSLLYAVAIGLSVAVTALVARRIGEKNTTGAVTIAAQTIWLGVIIGSVVGIVGVFNAEAILRFMGAGEAVIAEGKGYMAIMLGGSINILFLFLLNAVYRGAGNASIAMRSLWLANGINIILDPCLIFGLGPFPEMGVTGAAIATNIGRSIGVIYQLYHLFDGRAIITLTLKRMAFVPGIMLSLLKLSVGGIGQILIATASWVVLMKIVAAYGSEAVAGYTIAIRIVIFTILPVMGMSNAAATLVGQNLGAAHPERAEHSVFKVLQYTFLFLVVIFIFLFIYARPLMGIFSADTAVIDVGVDCLRIFAVGLFSFCLGIVLIQALNGAGDTMTPTRINLLCFWAIEIPLAWVLAEVMLLGPQGVFIAIPVAETLMAVLAWMAFRKGAWKLNKV